MDAEEDVMVYSASLMLDQPVTVPAEHVGDRLRGKQGVRRMREALNSGGICGQDDNGRFYSCLEELWEVQERERASFYLANAAWWDDGGYGGGSVESAMIGDALSSVDVESSVGFLARLLQDRLLLQTSFIKPVESKRLLTALDAGAGVGRVTRNVLLPHCASVQLVEASPRWVELSREYVSDAAEAHGCKCAFSTSRLEEYLPAKGAYDLIWVQWSLQYLTDADVIRTLEQLGQGLREASTTWPAGVLIVKENTPYRPHTNHACFKMTTPEGPARRYDMVRPKAHHQALFERARMSVVECEPCDETCVWTLVKI